MSLHRSLKAQPSALNQHRNVLRRAERIGWLIERDRFDPETDSPLGLAKVINRRVGAAKKKKAAKVETPAGETPAEEKPATK